MRVQLMLKQLESNYNVSLASRTLGPEDFFFLSFFSLSILLFERKTPDTRGMLHTALVDMITMAVVFTEECRVSTPTELIKNCAPKLIAATLTMSPPKT